MHLTYTCCAKSGHWSRCKRSGIEPMIRRGIADINRSSEIVRAYSTQSVRRPNGVRLARLGASNAAQLPSPCQVSDEAMLVTEERHAVGIAGCDHLISGELRRSIAIVAVHKGDDAIATGISDRRGIG